MNGETNLKTLMATMRPVLLDGRYVFCSVSQAAHDGLEIKPLGTFQEQEGITIIITEEQAKKIGLPYDLTWACITLQVYSSLSAVGFLATLTSRLAQAGISVNAISAFYHDHLFVPWESRETAMKILEELAD
jgi:uncharacterized protein